ncbi:MAG: hypothetical protein KDB02_10920 [Acidimicrobiales bacterium]|nr:hypothetical protein [Acidimicrobiales bacterium]
MNGYRAASYGFAFFGGLAFGWSFAAAVDGDVTWTAIEGGALLLCVAGFIGCRRWAEEAET